MCDPPGRGPSVERRGEPAAHKDLLVPEDCGSGAVCLLHRKLKGQGVKGELKAISHTHTQRHVSCGVSVCEIILVQTVLQ